MKQEELKKMADAMAALGYEIIKLVCGEKVDNRSCRPGAVRLLIVPKKESKD